VFRPERFGRRMGHIPASNPFVSKLAGMAHQVVRAFALAERDSGMNLRHFFDVWLYQPDKPTSW
jgi:hypothetical protein